MIGKHFLICLTIISFRVLHKNGIPDLVEIEQYLSLVLKKCCSAFKASYIGFPSIISFYDLQITGTYPNFKG